MSESEIKQKRIEPLFSNIDSLVHMILLEASRATPAFAPPDLKMYEELEYLRRARLEDRNRLAELHSKMSSVDDLHREINLLRGQVAELSKTLKMQEFIDVQMLYDVAKAIVQGIEGKHSEGEILDQLKLILDREAQQAILEGRHEYKEGKAKTYLSVEDLLKELKKTGNN